MKISEILTEKWSQKYKSSINCSHPKGFSQKAHCAGKKKHNESVEMEMVCESCGMCETHGNVMEIKKGAKDSNGVTKCWPGKHAEGTKKGRNGGQVRNCVPNESVAEAANAAQQAAIAISKKKKKDMAEAAKHGLYYNVNKRKAAGTSRPANSPKAPTAQAWKDAAKTAKTEGYNFKGGFPFDVDHMPGAVHKQDLDTKKKFTDEDLWLNTVNKLNSSLYDDNSDYISSGNGYRVEIMGKVWAKWDGIKDAGWIETSSLAEGLLLDEQFDAIEEMVESLAREHGVDAELIWEDFESVDDSELLETAAWRRKEGKSKKGGLNAKGVASYRRENPGSKLQTAVTTKPSKLKAGSKAAKRRKSFCARMGGVKGPMKKPNGKPTRKALALRKWNC